MASSSVTTSLPYHEPSIVTILIIASFLLALNAINYTLDRIVYCGLVGQLFIGIAWGTPGADWLSDELQHSIVQLGYIGLILIVYEGGLSSNFKALKANLFLSTAVAITGIAAPMGLSFALLGLLPITPVRAFAAGAALCSTSLGTTFTVLATSGLTESRLGVVLTSAAMMDDVVGLIMVQIISSLGGNSTFTEITVIRPVFVSLAFAVVCPLLCVFIARPAMRIASNYARQSANAKVKTIICSHQAAFVYQTAVLLATVTGATYAGTSNLFAAYLTGAAITWLDDTVGGDKRQPMPNNGSMAARIPSRDSTQSQSRPTSVGQTHASGKGCSGREIYERYYSPALEAILRPLFFASIGFAIPISSMFSGHVVWRGIVYTIFMLFAKLVCGTWLIRFAPMPHSKTVARFASSIKLPRFRSKKAKAETAAANEKPTQPSITNIGGQHPPTSEQQGSGPVQDASSETNSQNTSNEASAHTSAINTTANISRKRTSLPRPKSLYPAAILGSAMVSRGEIGFLISSVAESRGVFGEAGGSDEFLVVTWAILLCTLIGPITVGLLVKRVKRLQEAERQKATGHEDPLGIWGVLPSRSVTS